MPGHLVTPAPIAHEMKSGAVTVDSVGLTGPVNFCRLATQQHQPFGASHGRIVFWLRPVASAKTADNVLFNTGFEDDSRVFE